MKIKRDFPFAHVTKKQEKTIKNGHPWIYEDEIIEENMDVQNGALIDVFGLKDNYLGTGLYSEHSKIKVRLLGNNANEKYTSSFFERRTAYAVQYRIDVMRDDFEACRLIHGESDGLPGVTVDKYGDILVSEITSYGMEIRKEIIYQALKDTLHKLGVDIRGIYERNENGLRKKEGLSQYKGWYEPFGKPESTVTLIDECGMKYEVDFENGQKTGFFLDQKYNRLSVRKLAKGKRVLDCCTHTGSFALNAALGGADYVLASDISRTALDEAERNAQLNHLTLDFKEADVFELLPQLKNEHAKFDMIILDPPAFTKSRKTIRNAYSGYQKINAMAMRILPRGGYLVTNSCSHFMEENTFLEMLKDAAKETGVNLRLVEKRYASPDHPIMLEVPETSYLKFVIVEIV